MSTKIFSILILWLLSASCAPSEKDQLLREAEEAVRRQMRDPDSVLFRDSHLSSVYPDRGLVCMGEFNAKNGYGGYVGYRNYQYSREHGVVITGSETYSQSIASACLEEFEKKLKKLKKI